MKNGKRDRLEPTKGADLRHRAEGHLPSMGASGPENGLGRRADPDGESAAERDRLLHELEVHQIELGLQNEELRTARAETEAGLRRFAELFDYAPVGYATLTDDGAIRELNHQAAAILRQPRGKLVGSLFASFLVARDWPLVDAMLRGALDGEIGATGEAQLHLRGEAPTFVRLSARVLDGAEPRMLVAFQDITESRAREDRLARTERALREANQRKDEFLAALSHELRNPLAPIRNSLFVLSRTQPGGEQAKHAQAVIERQVTHLTRLVDDLLDVTRITRGKIELRREHVELGELVRRTIDDHRASFEAGGLSIEGCIEGGPFWAEADPARLVQAVSNLLTNAEKFTSRGGQVTVSLTRDGTLAQLRVSDTGAGVSPDLMPHLFEPFVQAPQTIDRTRGGLGLGLAMVKGLVELHGGTVRLASQGPGKGTEITMLLPIEPVREQALDADTATIHASSQRRLLIIEDNPDAADSLRDALELSGHEVQVAYDGPRGIELARTFHPEIVLCDIGLPRMDGYAVARAIRSDEALRGTHLVALSGYAQPEDLEHATQAGFNRHVAKPPSLEALERLIADVPVREDAPVREKVSSPG